MQLHTGTSQFSASVGGCLCERRGTCLQLGSSSIAIDGSQSQPLQCDQVVSFNLICVNPRNKNSGPGGYTRTETDLYQYKRETG